MEANTVNLLYPTTHNTTDRFTILATTDDDDDDDKTKIINNQTNKKMETSYSTSIIQIIKQEAIADTGATGYSLLPGTPVKNMQPSSKPISINIPDGSKLRSTHTGNLDTEGILEKANRAHIVPGLSHKFLTSISVL